MGSTRGEHETPLPVALLKLLSFHCSAALRGEEIKGTGTPQSWSGPFSVTAFPSLWFALEMIQEQPQQCWCLMVASYFVRPLRLDNP